MNRVHGWIASVVVAGTGRDVLAGVAFSLVLALGAAPASAGGPTPFEARAGIDLAMAAARSWAPDAYAVYVENDEDVDAHGAAARWGYLVYSPLLDRARAYSIRDGRLVVGEDLGMRFGAPPLATDWIDSGAAFAIAEREAARLFRGREHGRLATMLLMRGAFDEQAPDETTWTMVYTVPGGPSLFVVVDAAAGKVRRTWRG